MKLSSDAARFVQDDSDFISSWRKFLASLPPKLKAVYPPRRPPRKRRQRELLAQQANRCYWCHQTLTKAVWDHRIPFKHTLSCADEEFVASCAGCNYTKSDRMFDSDAACRDYIRSKRRSVPQYDTKS